MLADDTFPREEFASLSIPWQPDPDAGTAEVVDDKLVYTPSDRVVGRLFIPYVVTLTDGSEWSSDAGVLFHAYAVADTAATDCMTAVTVDALANDFAPNNPEEPWYGEIDLSDLTVDVPAHGTVSVEDGKVVYTPSEGWVGADTFTYSSVEMSRCIKD